MKKKSKLWIIIAAIVVVIVTMLIVQKDSTSIVVYNSLEEFNGHKVGIQTGTLYEDPFLEKVPNAQIEFYDDASAMILSVKQGKLDAYLTESDSFLIEQSNHPGLARVEESVFSTDIGMVYSPEAGNGILYSQMEEFIAGYLADGTRDDMVGYWMENYNPDTCAVDKTGITGENGVITVAVEAGYEPYSYTRYGQNEGFDIDFIYRFCRKYGYEPQFMSLTFDAIAPAVASGKADIGTGILIDEERTEEVKLSSKYTWFDIDVAYFGVRDSDVNFLESIADSFYKTFVKDNRWREFLSGLEITVIITILSVIIGTILGFGAYLLCKDGNKIAIRIMDAFSWVVHGLPALVLILVLFYVVFGKTNLSGVVVATIGFTLVFACSMYDMITSGVKAVGIGQYEAARSQGFTSTQAFFKVILPQAAYFFLPNYKGEVVGLLKETSIVGYIAVLDLTKMSDLIRARTYEAFFPIITTALIYLLLIVILTAIINTIQPVIDVDKRGTGKILKGVVRDQWDKQ